LEIVDLCESQDGLGESPIWNDDDGCVYWCDHVAARWERGQTFPYGSNLMPSIKRYNVKTGELDSWTMPEQVGSIGFRTAGGLVGGTNSGFVTIDLKSGSLTPVADPESTLPDNRFNDGKVDREGRFWCGTMDTRVSDESARLYVLDPDHSCRHVAEDYTFRVSNGMAFDPEGTKMYFADTFRKTIFVFDYDLKSGQISNRREFFSTSDHPGMPDGGTVDAEGFYWISMVQGGRILRLDPEGRVDRVVEMPIPTPTCVAFGGDNYETLFVTSQKAFLSEEMLKRYPATGNLFALHGLGVRGLPEPRFRG